MLSRTLRPSVTVTAAALTLAVAWRVPATGQQPAASPAPETRWWMTEPVRFLQTNLAETDSTVDPRALVAAVHAFGANTYLMNMGGIVAQYPTKVPFHYPSAFLGRAATSSGKRCAKRQRAARRARSPYPRSARTRC